MARWGSDPEVKAWMKDHEEEVARIERLYNLLKDMDNAALEDLAIHLRVDVARRHAQFRDNLITDIVKASPEKALEIVSGQGILLQAKEG